MRRINKQRGQAILEYLIIVSLVAIVGIKAFTMLGASVKTAAIDSAKKITNQEMSQ